MLHFSQFYKLCVTMNYTLLYLDSIEKKYKNRDILTELEDQKPK